MREKSAKEKKNQTKKQRKKLVMVNQTTGVPTRGRQSKAAIQADSDL